MKKITFLIPLVLFAGIVAAQENNFLLYSFKGNVSVLENKVESKARIGQALNSDAVLKMGNGSLATLICNEASLFTLTKAGNYALSKLADSCHVTTASISANYIRYVWNQMTHSTGSPGSNRKAFMNTVGAVIRSINNIWIDPRLDTVNYCSGDFPLSWKSYAETEEFEFSLYSNANTTEPAYKNNLKTLRILISSFISKMSPGNTYYWTSAVKGEQNEELKVLNYVTKQTLDAVVNEFKKQGPASEGPAEQAYRVAFMLEDAHYLSEAYQYYMKAVTADPNNALYRFTLMSFKKDYEIK